MLSFRGRPRRKFRGVHGGSPRRDPWEPESQATFLHCDLTVTEPQHNIEAVTEMDTRYINKRGGVWHILLSKNLCGERKFLPVKRYGST